MFLMLASGSTSNKKSLSVNFTYAAFYNAAVDEGIICDKACFVSEI